MGFLLRQFSLRSPMAGHLIRFAIRGATLVVRILLTRLGSLHTEVIDWDESTFILMSADLLQGRLPYMGLFDNKPPMFFFVLAGAMKVFGDNLLVVRLFGAACIVLIC